MDKANSHLLGGMLLRRRSTLRLSLNEISVAAGISASYYSSIENSKRIPPPSTLARILYALSFPEAEQREIKQMAAVERGLSPDDADLPDDVQALIAEIRKATAVMPSRFVKALRLQIREISS